MTIRRKIHNINSLDDTHRWFKSCYDQNFTSLYQYAKSITHDVQSAEDIVSEVFMNLWSNRDSLTSIRDINSYLFITVKNSAIRFVTRNPNSFFGSNLEETIKEIDRHDPEQVMLEQELVGAINDAINALPDKCQIVYKLIRQEGKSVKEVATEMGISEGTVKNHMTKAVSRIREEVTDYLEASGSTKSNYGSFSVLLFLGTMGLLG